MEAGTYSTFCFVTDDDDDVVDVVDEVEEVALCVTDCNDSICITKQSGLYWYKFIHPRMMIRIAMSAVCILILLFVMIVLFIVRTLRLST